jgi:TatD DNase family protein
MIVDSHCHLDYPQFTDDLKGVLDRAEAMGVSRFVTISTHVARFATYAAIAEADPRVFCSVGTHPHHAAEEPDVSEATLVELSQHARCVAIGEAGLDYHYDRSPRDVQQRVFRRHIAAARTSCLPLVIHARNADDDMIATLRDEMGKGAFSAVLHCFSSGPELARVGVELGLYLSFSGILTFKRSEELREIAAATPLDRILVETDAPYLAPEPYRGKPCEPGYTSYTAATLAKVKGVSDQQIATATTANFCRLFRKAAALDPTMVTA